ncbi:MAG: DUF502 domain-containing protein [Candidatus Bipolaricaulota bacterium]
MRTLLAYIKNSFINGLLVILPLGFTFYILWLIYRMIINFTGKNSDFGKLISNFLMMTIGQEWFPGIGAIFTFLLVLLLGVITRIYIGRRFYALVDKLMGSTPIVNKMYVTVKQVINAILSRNSSTFRDVVLLEYPRRGTYTLGFVTNNYLGKLEDIIGKDVVAVFIFTTPNPLSGMTIIVPKEDLNYLGLTIEEGLRLVLSMGIVIPAKFLDNKTGEKLTGED